MMRSHLTRLMLITLGAAILQGCQTKITTPRTALSVSSLPTLVGTTATFQTVVIDLGADFAATNICSGKTVLGVAGTAACGASSSAVDPRTGSVYLVSTAPRNAGTSPFPTNVLYTVSSQLTMLLEIGSYGQVVGGIALPSSGSYVYRDIPDRTLDDDGYTALTLLPAPRPAALCGSSGTIAARIADCTTQNPTTTPWDGAVKGHSGETLWSLVTKMGANKEVWQDSSTGLVWSSIASGTANWCQASGNTQSAPLIVTQVYNTAPGTPMTGTGTISAISGGTLSAAETVTVSFTGPTAFTVTGVTCTGGVVTGGLTGLPGDVATYSVANVCNFTFTAGATQFAAGDTYVLTSTNGAVIGCDAGGPLQPVSPVSFCAEGGTLVSGFGTDNWATNTYDNAKGGMGATSTDVIRWRLPTLYDYERADVDGIRNVMPDMGIAGASRPVADASVGGAIEWTATGSSNTLANAEAFGTAASQQVDAAVTTTYAVRCVGR
jgi:hypothetical protein